MRINKYARNTMASGFNLSQKVVKGGVYLFSFRIIQQLLTFSKLLIIARILSPSDFGLIGIALLTMTALETFSQTGFQSALIQTKKDIKIYLDAAWTLLVLRGLFLFTVLFIISPYIANFFEIPNAKTLIQFIGFSILFQSFTNIGVVYFQRDLELKKHVFFLFSGTFTEFVVTISAVYILRNVWALVLGLLAGSMLKCVVSYIIHSYRPHFRLDLKKTLELFKFGKWVMASSILVFLINQGDDIFVGKFIGVTALGLYQMAFKISNIPTTEITHVISQVTFPAYSKLQADLPKLKEAFLKVLQLTAFFSFLIAGLIFILSTDLIKIFLGEKWLSIVPSIKVLVFAGLWRSIAATSGFLFYAVSKPKIDMQWQIIRFLILIVLIYPFAKIFGILGVSIVVFLSIFVSNIGFSFNAIKITKCNIKSFIMVIAIPLLNMFMVILIIGVFKAFLEDGMLEFCILACTGIFLYLIFAYFFDRFFNYGIKKLLIENFGILRSV